MILNLYLTSIETRMYSSPEEIHQYHNINIRNEIIIKSSAITKSSLISGEVPILKIEWTLSIDYLNPSIGYIRLSGIMNYHCKDPEIIIKKMPVDVRNEISNYILLNMASYLIETAKFHNLPSPIPIPKIEYGQQLPENKSDNNMYR